jgi:cytochrome P450
MSLLSRLRRLVQPTPRAGLSAPALAQTIDFNDSAIAADPFPYWEALRDQGPVHFLPRTGGWLVLGYDEVKEAFGRPDVFSNAPYRDVDAVLLGEDPPRQPIVRRLVTKHFTAEALQRLEETAARTARAAVMPRFDAVRGFSQPVARRVAGELAGFDAETFALIEAAVDAASTGPAASMIAALDAFTTRAGVYQDLLRDGEGVISEAEARSLVRLLWLAAHTTTERVIARCIMRLLFDSSLQRTIRAERTLLTPFIEEVMRLHAPEQVLPRLTVAEAHLGGHVIPPGSAVFLCVGAANRDPAHFEAPAELRLGRAAKRHFEFGYGIHHCVGAPLARRVLKIALETLLDSAAELRPGEPFESIPMFATLSALAPTRLMVET